MKLLSIIVPSYNMEKFLAHCVESVLSSSSCEDVEVIIVNDGSRDNTLRIAQDFAARYANTVRVVDKENGNYGSAVNAGLAVAEGEYIKILDADDSFDSCRVADMVTFLHDMQGVDMVVTPFVEISESSSRRVDYNLYSRKVYEYGKVYDADTIFADGAIRFFMMHGVCYRTALLRDMHYRQTEGISYTDQEWVFYPLFKVQTIAFADIPLYRYNVAREGQTMDAAVQMRSLSQLLRVTEALARYFSAEVGAVGNEARRLFLRNIVVDRIKIVYRKYLLSMPDKEFAESDFASVDARLQQLAAECGTSSMAVPVNNVLKVDLLGFWRRRGRRYCTPLRKILIWADELMMWVHALIFRQNK